MNKRSRNPGFRISEGKGFHIVFANGFAVSVQFGPGNYADIPEAQGGRFGDFEGPLRALKEHRAWEAGSAEIAVFAPDGEFLNIQEHDQVAGYVSPEHVAAVIALASVFPAETTPEFASQAVCKILETGK